MELIVAAAILGAAIVLAFWLRHDQPSTTAARPGASDELARLEERARRSSSSARPRTRSSRRASSSLAPGLAAVVDGWS